MSCRPMHGMVLYSQCISLQLTHIVFKGDSCLALHELTVNVSVLTICMHGCFCDAKWMKVNEITICIHSTQSVHGYLKLKGRKA